jgi:hypothetical protein
MASRALLASLLLCSFWGSGQAEDSTTKKPVSTLYSDELDTTFSINLPDDSKDVNFFLSSPLFAWFGVGFSAQMAGSPMLLFYSSADGKGQSGIILTTDKLTYIHDCRRNSQPSLCHVCSAQAALPMLSIGTDPF